MITHFFSPTKTQKPLLLSVTGPRLSKSKHAGLVMPVLRFHKTLKKNNYAKNIRVHASIYVTAVIEYLCAEILEVSGETAVNLKKKRITPRHICLATRQDQELSELLKNVVFPEGGVIPHIHQELQMKKSK